MAQMCLLDKIRKDLDIKSHVRVGYASEHHFQVMDRKRRLWEEQTSGPSTVAQKGLIIAEISSVPFRHRNGSLKKSKKKPFAKSSLNGTRWREFPSRASIVDVL